MKCIACFFIDRSEQSGKHNDQAVPYTEGDILTVGPVPDTYQQEYYE